MLSFVNALIRWSFYLLFILVPIIFVGNTSELFELNKMWVTFGLTLIIASSWISKMCIERQIKIKRTPLDIPIILFLLSQTVATVFSIDPHTSLWGYYSRFNGGLLSLMSYAFLYFAFVSNIERKNILKYIFTGIGAAVFVALWGLPSHFGYDPTCLLFRGTLDVSCWTFAFQPKVRIFSTLGQPDWLAAYLVFMLPLTVACGFIFHKAKKKLTSYFFILLTILFYVDLLYTKARSGFAAFLVSLGIFFLVYITYNWRSFAKHNIVKAIKAHNFFLATLCVFVVFTFFIGAPLSQLDKFSLNGLQSFIAARQTVQQVKQAPTKPAVAPAVPVQEFGGTDSGKIRLFVWQGAWQIFLHNPLFGTGVETFAYSYYAFRPAGHNLTSEWDYLYNKAHNEFLNYLATTGIFGFGTYIFLLAVTLWIMARYLWQNKKLPEEQKGLPLLSSPYALRTLTLALFAGYISILVTNFFGFSVVIMNLYLFFTPVFFLFLVEKVSSEHVFLLPKNGNKTEKVSEIAWIGISISYLIAVYFLVVLIRFWMADVSYALGQNLDHVNQYNAAYSYLHDAVATRPSEPVFQDELSLNDAVLSVALAQQKDTANAAKLRDEAIAVSNNLVQNHPRVVTFWKSRVRIFYTLSQENPQYIAQALDAIEHAASLAPTDAKVWYNMGLLYDQTGNLTQAIATMERTTQLKPDYRDAYYALGIFYRQQAVGGDSTSKVIKDPVAEKKAVNIMHFILTNFGPNDDLKIKDTLSAWGEK